MDGHGASKYEDCKDLAKQLNLTIEIKEQFFIVKNRKSRELFYSESIYAIDGFLQGILTTRMA